MADIESNIRIDIDTAAALASLKNLQREISAFQTAMAKGSATTVARARDLQQDLINNINATGKFSANLRTIKTTTETFTNSLEKNKLTMGEYFRYAGASTKTFGRLFTSEFSTIEKVARERVKTLQTQYIKLGRDANGAMQAIAVRPLSLDMENLATKTAIAAQKQQILNQLLKQGSTNLLNFGKNTQWAGRQLMVGFTIPLTIFGTTAAQAFMQMEEAAIKFKKVYGDLFTLGPEREQALASIQELGLAFTQYGIAVSDTVNLAAEAAAAGFQGVDLQRQTTQATRLSVLGQLDQQKALETTISLQNAFRMSSENLAESIDFLNAVENQTVVSLDDVTTAIPKVAPVIQQLGGDVKDLAFFLAAMKEGGVNASEGANALKSGLASLINPTEKAAQMLAGFGINIRGIIAANKGDLKGTVVGFAQALDQLDPLARAQAIEQLFGKFQFARLSALFDNVIRQGNQASRVLDLAQASAADLAAMSQQELGMTSASAMNQFKAAVEELRFALVPVGEEFLKAITPIVNFATDVLENFNNLDDGVKRFVVNLTGLLGVVGPVALMTFGLLANGVANIIKGFTFVRNVFTRAGQSSTVLGEQVDYMTQQQLEAASVAASLDQVHQNLRQTFTSEAAAVNQLAAAYQKAVAAQRALGGKPIASTIKPKKMAQGGVVMVPGSGKGDKVPAMLEPGEAVIPGEMVKRYAPLIDGMIAGNIPGYVKGKGSGSKSRDLVHTHAQEALDPNMFREEFAQGVKAMGLDKLPKELLEQLNVQLLGSLTAELPQWLNVKFKEAGASIQEFETTMNSVSGIFKSSARSGGFNATTVGGSEALQEFQNMVRDETISLARQNGGKVTDPIFAQATERVIAKLETQVGRPINELARVLRSRKNTPGVLRASGSSAQLRELEAQGMLRNQPGTRNYTYADTGTMIGRKRSSGNWNASLNAYRFQGGYFNQPYEAQITNQESFNKVREQSRQTARVASKAYNDESKKMSSKKNDLYLQNRDRNSPHRLAAQDGKDDANAYNTARSGQSGKGTSNRSDAARRGWETRRANQNAALNAGGVARGAGFAGAMDKFGGKLMGLSFAMSAVSGIMMMFGGQVGEIGGILFGLSNAMFALITVTQLLTQTKMGEVIASAASARAANVKTAMGVAEGASLFTKGGGIAGLFGNLGRGLSFVLRFLGPVGIGLSLLAIGIPFLVGVIEEQRKKIEGLGNTANLTGEKLERLGNIFDVQAREADFSSAFVSTGGTQKQRTLTQQVRESDNFATDFEEQITAVRNATTQNAELALRSMSIQLAGSGFAKEQVDAIVRAIAAEAGRRDLNLSFATIDISTPEGLGQIAATAKAAGETTGKAFAAGFTPEVTQEWLWGSQLQISPESITDDAKAAAETAAGSFASLFEGLKTGFEGGLIDAQKFTEQLSIVSQELSSLDPNFIKQIMPTLIDKMGLTEEMAGITNLSDQLLILEAAVAGVNVSDYIEIFKAAEESNDPGAQRAATRARKQLTTAIKGQAKATEQLNIQEAAGAAATELQDKIVALQGQIDAYNALVASGTDAAIAYQIVGDSALYAQYQAAAAADAIAGTTANMDAFVQQVAQLNELTKQFEGIGARVSSGGGGGQKSPFQEAIDQLKEQRKEIANTVVSYSKLRKAGLNAADAFEASRDPILAAALATTKVGTDKWKQLIKLIKQTTAAAKQLAVLDALQQNLSEIGLMKGMAAIAPMLSKLGLSLEDIENILSDPNLAQALVDDLKDGVINSQAILNYLNSIPAMKQVQIMFNMSTPEGLTDMFEQAFDREMEYFDLQQSRVEAQYDSRIRSAQAAVEAAQDAVDKIQDSIDAIQSKVDAKQREIELTINRPIEDFQEAIETIQREIELQFDRPIAALQEESSDLANDLALMDRAVDKINERYDAQQEALDKISSINQEIIDQQKTQIDLADALSQGDISAAARAAQEVRSAAAQGAMARRGDLLESAREAEIQAVRSPSGLTREQIEQRQFEISQEIYRLEEQREKKQAEILVIQDKIYALEQLRKPLLAEIQVLEDEIYKIQTTQLEQAQDNLEVQQEKLEKLEEEKQKRLDAIDAERQEWEELKMEVDEARLMSEGYRTSLETVRDWVAKIRDMWAQVGQATANAMANITNSGIPSAVPNGGGGGGTGSGTTENTNPATMTNAQIQKKINELTTRNAEIDKLIASINTQITALGTANPEAVATLKARKTTLVNEKSLNLKAIAEYKKQLIATPTGGGAGTPMQFLAKGGMVKYMAKGGFAKMFGRGTDTVPAMLTPGEYVISRPAVEQWGQGFFDKINNGFTKPSFNMPIGKPGMPAIEKNVVVSGGSVYNSYEVNVNVETGANPDQIARAVITQIRQIDSQRLRSNRF